MPQNILGWLLALGLFAIPTTGTVLAVPMDNPVASYYPGPEGYPAWTDTIAWNNVIDMAHYAKGKTNFEKFENARDELAAKGGGVLYYPAGTYDFTQGPFDGPRGRGLMLKKGIVIRGEGPTSKSDARSGKLDLGTRFVFGFQKKGMDAEKKLGGEVPRHWNLIGLAPARGESVQDVDNVGICWVHLEGATVYFGPQLKWGPTWGTSGGWKSKFARDGWKDRVPDGTFPFDPFMGCPVAKKDEPPGFVGAGKGRLVFGCTIANAAVLNDCFEEGNGPEHFHTYRFGPRIGVTGRRVFIANNILPISTKNFLYKNTTRKSIGGRGNFSKLGEFIPDTLVMFDYGKACGIDVNKLHVSAFGGEGVFLPGVIVRDNWVFNHGHMGYSLAGKWVTIQNNINERIYLKGGEPVYGLPGGWVLTTDGNIRSNAGGGGGISDNLSRAFDLAGKNLWVDRNNFNNVGSNPGNDGEGILCQLHGGTHLLSWAITHNQHEKGTGQSSYIGAWDVDLKGCLMAWNETAGWVGAVNVGKREILDCAFVANKAAAIRNGGKKGEVNVPGVLLEAPKETPAPPRDVKAVLHEGDAVKITWTDTSSNEIGFRIDRSWDDKNWTAIAYRPRHEKNDDPESLMWIDFSLPPGRTVSYRVVALNAEDNDRGASQPSAAIAIEKK